MAQFFAVHKIAESAWASPYSWAHNNISDLGNALCAVQPEPEPRYICSPRHALMNGSFVTLGVLLVLGVILTAGVLWRRNRTAATARVLLAGAGAGFALVGLAPADTNENQHVLGALLIMATGNIGLVLTGFGLSQRIPSALRRGSTALGATALAALGLFLSHQYAGLGMGGTERAAAFPLLLWALVAGVRGLITGRTDGSQTTPTAQLGRAGRSARAR
ncbi:DUF998 domain-containing protein [Kitasatospora purpeofusca]|uniref:DUF998 domain-containing protein n=1 Tax=Kitasatospora purpeofusca TaxID=67352 RepID=UPI0037FFA66B